MPTATCHCGAVQLELPRRPGVVASCNCSLCRRYGTLWAYFRADRVKVRAAPGSTREYRWGGRTIRFVGCATCGCITHWVRTRPGGARPMGVNARNLPPELLAQARVRHIDGAAWPVRPPPVSGGGSSPR